MSNRFIHALFVACCIVGGGKAQTVDFDRDIQPILAARCLKCHGNGQAEGGLRLSDLDSAKAELDSGLHAVVPGRVDDSELLRRVSTDNLDERMPPEGPPLSKPQVEALRHWISGGAEWPAHWAYRELLRPQLPPVDADSQFAIWPRTAIDRFVLAKLVEQGLQPSAPADRRTLLRRVYFDLVGLPPTPDEIRAFEADAAPDAYERVIDRLLASPQYGERWARHWMDVVHYAETHGHDQDRPRENAWPYRDYLIQSFNADKPYPRFVQEQIAGDALFPNDPQAIVATGFLATGPWDESSLRDIREDTLDREIARYLDRDDIVSTVMSTFASTTVHCARCHDHKFDPVSQREYYALQAVFAGTDKANRTYDADPRVAQHRAELQTALANLDERLQQGDPSLLADELHDEIIAWETQLARAASRWQPVEWVEFHSGGGAELKQLDDGSLLAGGTHPDKDVYTLVVRPRHHRVTGLRLEVLTDDSLPKMGPGRQDNGNLHLNEVRAWATGDSGAAAEIELQNPKADFNQQGWSIDMAVDGNPNTAWGIFPEVGKPHQAVFALAAPIDGKPTLRVELSQIHGDGHLIGRLRLSTTDAEGDLAAAADAVSPALAAILRGPRGERTREQQLELAAAYLRQKWSAELNALPPRQMVYCGTSQFQADGSFRPAQGPRPVHVLQRGEVTKPLAEAQPAAMSCMPGLPGDLTFENSKGEGQRRAALARWMTDRRNVLTWRSMANRLWHYHFGRGLVDTPSDFGRMGSVPTHPQLLDWLAVELREGGSLKSLHRQIVTSAVYRQSSAHVEQFAEIDADNRLLWRMNRRRLDAESIRDAVLSIAGTLDNTMGGPSVKQFNQSPGVHVTPVVDYLNFDIDDPANRRRSVYRFIFRTLPDPFMDALDCPDASQLAPRRSESITALQALATLNDKTIVRQSEHLAARIAQAKDTPETQVEQAFWLILARPPSKQEAAAVGEYAAKHGLANACRMLLNSNEFMFVD